MLVACLCPAGWLAAEHICSIINHACMRNHMEWCAAPPFSTMPIPCAVQVWDYASDGYVHRLIQSKTDGKLVEVPSPAPAQREGTGAASSSM